jgi:hypothetical protein
MDHFPPHIRATVEAYRALGNHALRQPDAALGALGRARELLKLAPFEVGKDDLDPAGPGSGLLEDHLICLIALREAEAAVGSSGGAPASANGK